MSAENYPVTEATIDQLVEVTKPFLSLCETKGNITNVHTPFFDTDTTSYYQALGLPPMPSVRNIKVYPSDPTRSWLYIIDYEFIPYKTPTKNIVYPRPIHELETAESPEDFFDALTAPAKDWAQSRKLQEQLGLSFVTEVEVRLIVEAFDRFNNETQF